MRRGATFISHLVEGPDTLRAVPGFTPRFASNPGGPVARDMQEGMRVRPLKKYWNLPPCWQSKSHWTEKNRPGKTGEDWTLSLKCVASLIF